MLVSKEAVGKVPGHLSQYPFCFTTRSKDTFWGLVLGNYAALALTVLKCVLKCELSKKHQVPLLDTCLYCNITPCMLSKYNQTDTGQPHANHLLMINHIQQITGRATHLAAHTLAYLLGLPKPE